MALHLDGGLLSGEHDHRPQRIDLHLHWPGGERLIREGFLMLAARITELQQQLTKLEARATDSVATPPPAPNQPTP